jgi:hypothetical protein
MSVRQCIGYRQEMQLLFLPRSPLFVLEVAILMGLCRLFPVVLQGEIEKAVTKGETPREKARAAYLAICLDFAPALKEKYPQQWSQAIAALNGYPRVLQAMFFEAPFPAGDRIREKAAAAGLSKPATNQKLW